jgi:hypothetical protein
MCVSTSFQAEKSLFVMIRIHRVQISSLLAFGLIQHDHITEPHRHILHEKIRTNKVVHFCFLHTCMRVLVREPRQSSLAHTYAHQSCNCSYLAIMCVDLMHCMIYTQPGPYGRVNDPYDGDWALGPLGGKAVNIQVRHLLASLFQFLRGCVYMYLCWP